MWTNRNPPLSILPSSEWNRTFQNQGAASADQWIHGASQPDDPERVL